MNPKFFCSLLVVLIQTPEISGQPVFQYDQQSALEGPGPESASSLSFAQPFGQSFTPTLDSVGFIRLLMDAPFGSATVAINLRADSITGPVLGTSDLIFMPNLYSGFPNFFFTTPVAVTPGVTYYMQPFVQSGSSVGVFHGHGYGYTGGNLFGLGAPLPSQDLWFREGVIVPEPSTIALVMLGMGAVAWRVRRLCTRAGD